jgi:GntR family transcriptional regulator, transcriptional repressor for pyruvate dehydrogenase complex
VDIGQAARPPAYQLLADDLRAQITSGRLRPGDRLPAEPEMCARSGVSRSTVREALRLLASQHLIVTTRGVTGGSFVAQPSVAQLADGLVMAVQLLRGAIGTAELFEVREMLEVPAAGLAALRRTDADLAALRAALFAPDIDDPDTMRAAQWTFHGALAAAAGNPLYELLARPLHQLSDERQCPAAPTEGLWRRIDAAHREILRCVTRRDVAGAAEATRTHLRFVRDLC